MYPNMYKIIPTASALSGTDTMNNFVWFSIYNPLASLVIVHI